ncbi:MAG: polysaccharide biosynthesis tyrosine autokinase [Flavobacteriales bacterium]
MSAPPAGDTIDLKAIFSKVLSKWWWFAITVLLCLGLGYAYIMVTPKEYLVRAVILMSDKGRDKLGKSEEFLKGSSLLGGNSDIEDQVAVLTSYSNVTKTLKRLDFGISYFETKNYLTSEKYEYPPFYISLDTVAVQVYGIPIHVEVDKKAGTYRVKAEAEYAPLYNVQKQTELEDFIIGYSVDQVAKIGEPFVAEGMSFTIEFPEDRQYGPGVSHHFTINSLDALVAEYRAKTMAAPVSDESSIVHVSTVGQVVAKEKLYINKLLETYIEGEWYRRQQKGIKTINFIEDQIGIVSDSLRRVETSMEGFRGASGGMMSATTTSDALFQERSRLERERSMLLSRRQYCNSIMEKIRSQSDLRNVPAPSSSGIDDPVLNNLVLEITRLSAELAALNITTVKSNPTVIAMERKLKNLSSSLAQTAESLVDQVDISLAEVDRNLSKMNYQFSQLPENERKLGNIARKFKLSESLYNYLMEKQAEAGIAIASDQVDKYVVDEALNVAGKAVKPARKMVMIIALLVALAIPVIIILIRDFFNDTVTDVDQLKRLSAIPVLATIPGTKRKRVLPDEPKSLLAESFRTARINMQYLNSTAQRQVVGFTSSTSGEGKTFCALNLSTVMALSGKRVVLVDADMRRPRVAETLDMKGGKGLSTYLIGECALNDIVQKTDIPGLDVITAGPIPPNPLELVELPAMEALFRELRSQYDHVVVDASPMGLVSEFVIIMRHVDLTLYVVRQGYTRRGALRLINDMYKEKKVERIDLILNDVKVGAGYGAGYGYYTK